MILLTRQNVGEYNSSSKYKNKAKPVTMSEGVFENDDGEDKTDKFSQRYHQRHCQGSALCCQNKDCLDANVSQTELRGMAKNRSTHSVVHKQKTKAGNCEM